MHACRFTFRCMYVQQTAAVVLDAKFSVFFVNIIRLTKLKQSTAKVIVLSL